MSDTFTHTGVRPTTVPSVGQWRNLYYCADGDKRWGIYIWPTQERSVLEHEKWFRWYYKWLAKGGVDQNLTLWAVAMTWPNYIEGARFEQHGSW